MTKRKYVHPVRWLIKATNKDGKPEQFKIPGHARMTAVVAAIPTMRAKGFKNITICNAA